MKGYVEIDQNFKISSFGNQKVEIDFFLNDVMLKFINKFLATILTEIEYKQEW